VHNAVLKSSEDGMASDVFWVTDLRGRKVRSSRCEGCLVFEKFMVIFLNSWCKHCLVCEKFLMSMFVVCAVLKSSEDGMASDVFWVTDLRGRQVRRSRCEVLCLV
jgi:UTP:GlnB (protein PII) uridylyltransferase